MILRGLEWRRGRVECAREEHRLLSKRFCIEFQFASVGLDFRSNRSKTFSVETSSRDKDKIYHKNSIIIRRLL